MSRGGLLVLALLIAGILAFKFLPWYALVGIAIALVLGAKFLGKRLVIYLFSMPFRAKGAVLRNATATVHSVKPAEAPPVEEKPDDEEEDRAPLGPRNFYQIDVTVTPAPSQGPFHHWEVGELALVHPDFDQMNDAGPLADYCVVSRADLQVNENFAPEVDGDDDEDNEPNGDAQRVIVKPKVGEFVADRGYKVLGPQRLRLLVGVKPGAKQLRFAYYFEKFGGVELPVFAENDKKAARVSA